MGRIISFFYRFFIHFFIFIHSWFEIIHEFLCHKYSIIFFLLFFFSLTLIGKHACFLMYCSVYFSFVFLFLTVNNWFCLCQFDNIFFICTTCFSLVPNDGKLHFRVAGARLVKALVNLVRNANCGITPTTPFMRTFHQRLWILIKVCLKSFFWEGKCKFAYSFRSSKAFPSSLNLLI